MAELHSLARRQLKRCIDPTMEVAADWRRFVEAVSDAYHQSDVDRQLLERSLDLSSTELLQANADIRAVLQAFPDLFFRLDEHGVILSCKAHAPGDFLAPPASLVGRRIQDVPVVGVADLFDGALAKLRDDAAIVSIEYELPMPEGVNAFEARLVPMRGREVIAIIRNITERRVAEAALRSSEDQLRQSQKMDAIGRLAGGIAHDFNNLLTVIMGYAETVRSDHALKDERHIDEILRASRRAADLTQQLLAFSRRQVLQPCVLSLNEIVVEVEPMLRRLIGEHIEIVTALGPAAGHVRADRGQIEQVLLNLVINARDALTSGGTIRIQTDVLIGSEAGVEPQRESRVVLSVSDSGCGMSEETRQRIFEPFFTTKAPGKGTGLGLATVHGIVTQSGGSIEVESVEGAGSTFRLAFPRVAPHQASREATMTATPRAQGETILIVEDDDSVRRLLCELLVGEGYIVVEASTPTVALETMREEGARIDLVLTDVVMPGMSGLELARRLLAIRPDLRALFMSGYVDEALSPGFETADIPLIHKPFRLDTLARAIRERLTQPMPVPA